MYVISVKCGKNTEKMWTQKQDQYQDERVGHSLYRQRSVLYKAASKVFTVLLQVAVSYMYSLVK